MFLIWGVGDQRKEIAFDQWMDCPNCRQEAQIRIWKLQTSLNIFFIPTFRWNTRYYAQCGSCGKAIQLSDDLGEQIEQEKIRHIDPELFAPAGRPAVLYCPSCGEKLSEAANFCPHCGARLHE